MRIKTLQIAFIIGLLVTACETPELREPLPAPEIACSETLNWHGIIPGKSSRQDVVNILGSPSQGGNEGYDNKSIPFYAYKIESGVVSRYTQDRIFFRSDGIVDWIEEVVADRNGSFIAAQATINQIGNTVDTAYVNSNYDPKNKFPIDVLGGPDQIYVWSECGLALDMLEFCFPAKLDGIRCLPPEDHVKPGAGVPTAVTLRYPNPYPGAEPVTGADNAVLMRFLFPPTSYKGFTDYYMHKIPFGVWDAFLKEIPEQSK